MSSANSEQAFPARDTGRTCHSGDLPGLAGGFGRQLFPFSLQHPVSGNWPGVCSRQPGRHSGRHPVVPAAQFRLCPPIRSGRHGRRPGCIMLRGTPAARYGLSLVTHAETFSARLLDAMESEAPALFAEAAA